MTNTHFVPTSIYGLYRCRPMARFAPHPKPGFLLEAGPRVPAPVYFEQSARLLKVQNLKKKQQENKTLSTLTKY